MSPFVGRTEPLARLAAAYRAVSGEPSGSVPRWAGVVLVTGEAGIGKTALLSRFGSELSARGATVVWGTCWDGAHAPAWWPWTQALRDLIEKRVELRDAALPEVRAILPELGPAVPLAGADSDTAHRLRLFDAVGRLLARAADRDPVVVVLDDLHWSDPSTLDLMRFLARQPRPGRLLLVGSYRPHEPRQDIAAALAGLATVAEPVPLQSLSRVEVADLVRQLSGASAADRWAPMVHDRSGGHPFFARELCSLLASGDTTVQVPAAVRELILRRLAGLSTDCRVLLRTAAVAGAGLLPDLLADVAGDDPTRVEQLVDEAASAGIVARAADREPGAAAFVHDLYRETIYAALSPAQRLDLHCRIGAALVHRQDRGGRVFPAELAHHFARAVPRVGAGPALSWARVAARADTARLAYGEAAGHLSTVRTAVADAGQELAAPELVQLLTSEAELRLRAGDTTLARELLDEARTRAAGTGEAELLGLVALGLDRCGARFAMPRTDLIDALDTAQRALAGSGTPAEAQVTAALARQLQHSVPADRPRARPLAGQAVAIARRLDDPLTLASCLLALHDAVWTPGTGAQRVTLAREIAGLATAATDPERHAQALLLLATAQLEEGSPAFRATFGEYRYVTERLRQPGHDYLVRTRLAALALLDGDIDAGERLSAEAAALGDAVGNTDAGNVRMSQRLEIVRARGDAGELLQTAAEAVRWWIGAPAHAHAVAAGFSARAGDLDAARRELDTVLALDDWRTDRSYLWSVFVGEVAAAAIAVDDRALCRRLLDDLLPLTGTCAVNGALVCFMGSHAHRVGLLYAALGEPQRARRWLDEALDAHRRLGARRWEAETSNALDALRGRDGHQPPGTTADAGTDRGRRAGAPPGTGDRHPTLLARVGDMWQVRYQGRTAYLRDAKGLHDLAALVGRPGADLAALDLVGGREVPADSGADPVLDRVALTAYRRRLAELDDELAAAHAMSDLARRHRATDEREQLLAELRRATRPGGAPRPLGSTAAERARKAVTARIRDAIRRIADVHPELGAHLDRTVRTGTTCRYEPGGLSGSRR